MNLNRPSWCGVDHGEEESDARLELVRGAAERRIARSIGPAIPSRIRDAPVDGLRLARKLGADLADSVAQGDHEVEVSAGEIGGGVRTVGADVECAVPHTAGGVWGGGLWVGAGRVRHARA